VHDLDAILGRNLHTLGRLLIAETNPKCDAAFSRRQPEGDGAQTPVVGNGKVFVGAGNQFYAFETAPGAEPEREPVWTTTVDAPFFSAYAPSIANGVVYSTAGFHDIYAFDADTGQVLWNHRSKGREFSMRSSPTIAKGRLYHAATFEFTLYAFHVPTAAEGEPFTERPPTAEAPTAGE
jgi:outer membrane protein assembly factor BamB